ncbi:MAG: phosphoribosylglycinamide formyltransferase [Endomicrobiia bacterium]
MSKKLSLGWFATSRGSTSLKIFNYIYDSINSGELNAEIKFVFINRELKEQENSDIFIKTVSSYKIPIFSFSSLKFLPELKKSNIELWRNEFDKKVYEMIKNFKVDIVMLAGYMLVLSKFLCEKFNFINLHPALPWGPKGTWQEVINKIIEEKHKYHGVMTHIVTEELDRGPVLTYCKFEIKEYHFDKIRQEGVKYELPLVKKTLKLLADKKLEIINRKVFYNKKLLENGLEITEKELTE